jgi:hypothetical protein
MTAEQEPVPSLLASPQSRFGSLRPVENKPLSLHYQDSADAVLIKVYRIITPRQRQAWESRACRRQKGTTAAGTASARVRYGFYDGQRASTAGPSADAGVVVIRPMRLDDLPWNMSATASDTNRSPTADHTMSTRHDQQALVQPVRQRNHWSTHRSRWAGSGSNRRPRDYECPKSLGRAGI